jgi:hypothetical protein
LEPLGDFGKEYFE